MLWSCKWAFHIFHMCFYIWKKHQIPPEVVFRYKSSVCLLCMMCKGGFFPQFNAVFYFCVHLEDKCTPKQYNQQPPGYLVPVSLFVLAPVAWNIGFETWQVSGRFSLRELTERCLSLFENSAPFVVCSVLTQTEGLVDLWRTEKSFNSSKTEYMLSVVMFSPTGNLESLLSGLLRFIWSWNVWSFIESVNLKGIVRHYFLRVVNYKKENHFFEWDEMVDTILMSSYSVQQIREAIRARHPVFMLI